MNNQGSPGTRSLMFNGRDKASEVALRRQLQEKEREAKYVFGWEMLISLNL